VGVSCVVGDGGNERKGRGGTNRIHGTAVSSDAVLPVEGRFAEGACRDGGSSSCYKGEGEELHFDGRNEILDGI
jgi:hypothetical protein